MSPLQQALWAAVGGLPITIAIWLAATITAVGLGFLVGATRHFAPRAVSHALGVPVEVIRGTPFIVQAFLLYYGGPFIGLALDPVPAGWLALSIYGAAYFSETFRAGFAAIPPGQVEASRLLGLSTRQTVLHVLLPGMALATLPALANLAVILIKETAILSVITVPELTFRLTGVGSATFAFAEVTLVLALVYWALVEATGLAARAAERSVARAIGAEASRA